MAITGDKTMSQEAFERWFVEQYIEGTGDYYRIERFNEREYKIQETQMAWEAWQAALQAADAENFCDTYCTWRDHHPLCKSLKYSGSDNQTLSIPQNQ
jgi:type IV secretory pathway component VirB8